MTCGKCGYQYAVPMIYWSTVPLDINCPRCFPNRYGLSTSGTAMIESECLCEECKQKKCSKCGKVINKKEDGR